MLMQEIKNLKQTPTSLPDEIKNLPLDEFIVRARQFATKMAEDIRILIEDPRISQKP